MNTNTNTNTNTTTDTDTHTNADTDVETDTNTDSNANAKPLNSNPRAPKAETGSCCLKPRSCDDAPLSPTSKPPRQKSVWGLGLNIMSGFSTLPRNPQSSKPNPPPPPPPPKKNKKKLAKNRRPKPHAPCQLLCADSPRLDGGQPRARNFQDLPCWAWDVLGPGGCRAQDLGSLGA